MSVDLFEEVSLDTDPAPAELIRRVVDAACEAAECPWEASVCVTITDSESVHDLNLRTRRIDSTTDVLSFPMLELPAPGDLSMIAEGDWGCFDPETGELLLGDIVLNADRVISQAEEYGHSIERELAFLTAHSMFHLFGYDHEDDAEREIMEAKQRALLEGLGITR